jgi:hypothetical protein
MVEEKTEEVEKKIEEQGNYQLGNMPWREEEGVRVRACICMCRVCVHTCTKGSWALGVYSIICVVVHICTCVYVCVCIRAYMRGGAHIQHTCMQLCIYVMYVGVHLCL